MISEWGVPMRKQISKNKRIDVKILQKTLAEFVKDQLLVLHHPLKLCNILLYRKDDSLRSKK